MLVAVHDVITSNHDSRVPAMNEFKVIKQFFSDACGTSRTDVLTGIGDDAARVTCQQSVVTVNSTLQQQQDFQADHAAASVGHLLLAPALAQLIAKGAQPAWALLSLSLAQADTRWLQAFSNGLLDLAEQADVQLVGGDTTRGQSIRLSLNCHGIFQHPPAAQACHPETGDLIYVVGNLGENSLAILALQEEIHLPAAVKNAVLHNLHYPVAPLGLHKVHASLPVFAFPLTTGLQPALTEIVDQADCGASLYVAQFPCSEQVESRLELLGGSAMLAQSPQPCTLAMIVAADHQARFEQSVNDCGYTSSWVGIIESQPGVRLVD